LVINYDVPAYTPVKGKPAVADPETYLHRIGRTGRFGANGIAVTLWDRDIDKEHLDTISKYFGISDCIKKLSGPDELADLVKSLQD
jgi:ATP-dependent RNA helicase DDX19/DBP5